MNMDSNEINVSIYMLKSDIKIDEIFIRYQQLAGMNDELNVDFWKYLVN